MPARVSDFQWFGRLVEGIDERPWRPPFIPDRKLAGDGSPSSNQVGIFDS